MLLTLPPELVERIIRFAALPDHNAAPYPARQATLRACCLTCSVLRHIAQPILGKIVSFIDETTFDLYATRYRSDVPRVVDLTLAPLDRPWTAIASVLARCTALRSLIITGVRKIDLRSLEGLPNLRSVTLLFCTYVETDFCVPHVTKLFSAKYLTPAAGERHLNITPTAFPSLRALACNDPVPSPLLLAQLDALILLAHPRGSFPAITCISPSRVLLTGSSKDLDRAVATSPFPRANTHPSGQPFELLGTFADLLLSLNLSEVRLPLLCLPPSFRPGHPDFPKGAQAAILDHLYEACKARNVEVAWLDAGVDLVDGFWRYARKKRAEEEREKPIRASR